MGISNLLTENSKDIVTRPATNTSSESIVNAREGPLSINIGYIIFCQYSIYLVLFHDFCIKSYDASYVIAHFLNQLDK